MFQFFKIYYYFSTFELLPLGGHQDLLLLSLFADTDDCVHAVICIFLINVRRFTILTKCTIWTVLSVSFCCHQICFDLIGSLAQTVSLQMLCAQNNRSTVFMEAL